MRKMTVAVVSLLTAASAGAAAPSAAPARPDFSGTYERMQQRLVQEVGGTGGTRPNYQAGGPQQAPLKPEYQKQREERQRAAREADSKGEPMVGMTAACQGRGMPGMMSEPWPIEFIQSKNQLTIILEMYTQVRRIYIGKQQMKPDEVEPGFFGRSVGHWEGDTLVVDTIGLKPGRDPASPTSAQLHVKEKIYFGPDGNLRDEITLEDPVVLERPYTYTITYRRTPGYEILEYVCEDNHYTVGPDGRQVIISGPGAK